MNKFEQLIEYVINDDEQSARDLFHDIVVEKSRQIYEDIMEADEADDLLQDVGADEEGIDSSDDGEFADDTEGDDIEGDDIEGDDIEGDDGDDIEGDDGDEPATKSDIQDLKDELDNLMADFEQLMAAERDEPEHEGDFDDMNIDKSNESLEEGVSLSKAPAPKTSEEAGTQSKSPVAANSGARGAIANPVKASQTQENGRTAPKAYDMGGTTSPKQGPATKPTTSQASGVNNKSPL